MDKLREKTRRKNDVLLLAMLVLAAAVMLVVSLLTGRGQAAQVEISVRYSVEAVFPYGEVREWKWTDDGAYVTVVSGESGARIAASSCSDQLCVHQGAITESGHSIVCLPNRVVVRLISDENPDVDAMLH